MTEEQYFKRITMSLIDIRQCLIYLEKILICEDDIIHRALEEAIIISYIRPFSGYNKKYHEISNLKQEFKNRFNPEEIIIHKRIYKIRNSLVAHSDNKSYGITFSISELYENSKMVIPIMRRIPFLLNNEDIEILKNCCLKIENYLFKEQIRIKNLLPIGNY